MCSDMLSGDAMVGRMLVLALAGVGLAVPVRAVRSIWRQARATRRLLRVLPVTRVSPGSPSVVTVEHEAPLAFCAGYRRPRVYVSTGTQCLLAPAELAAVLAHERHHARRRDPLRLLLMRAAADALFFMPVLRWCRVRYGVLAERAADQHAIESAGVKPLASALAAFDEQRAATVTVSAERVAHLVGEADRARLSPVTLATGLLGGAGVAALAAITAVSFGPGQATIAGLASAACGLSLIALPLLAIGLATGLLLPRRR